MIEPGILTAIEQRVAAALTARARPTHALRVDGLAFGYVDDARRARLASFGEVFTPAHDGLALHAALTTAPARTAALDPVVRTLADEGALTAWRNERYAVRATRAARPGFRAPAAFLLERAAARYFGIHTFAAHANGLVGAGPRTHMWLARRSASKAIDPAQLDNLVGGGIAAGETARRTLVREAWEEAGIANALAARARASGEVTIERAVPDGFQRETIFVFDLPLPASFVPANQDGEVCEHRLLDLSAVARLLVNAEGPDVVTLDATLVALDCLRRNAVEPRSKVCP